MKQYFILSQINDWNTQTINNKAADMALSSQGDFPLDEIIAFVGNNNRLINLQSSSLENYKWFSLKILTPLRVFMTSAENPGRYNPELDHIFPQKLKGRPDDYAVDIVWNMQPVTGVINGSKLNAHPKVYFTASDEKTNEFVNNKIFEELYDFVPTIDYTTKPATASPLWDSHIDFITWRKEKMLKFFSEQYGLTAI